MIIELNFCGSFPPFVNRLIDFLLLALTIFWRTNESFHGATQRRILINIESTKNHEEITNKRGRRWNRGSRRDIRRGFESAEKIRECNKIEIAGIQMPEHIDNPILHFELVVSRVCRRWCTWNERGSDWRLMENENSLRNPVFVCGRAEEGRKRGKNGINLENCCLQ